MTTETNRKSAREADLPIPLRQNVQESIRRYLEDMGKSQPECLYRTLMAEVEPPLIEEVLRYTQGNQSKTAKIPPALSCAAARLWLNGETPTGST